MLLQFHTTDVDHLKEEECNLGGVNKWQDIQVHHVDNVVEKE